MLRLTQEDIAGNRAFEPRFETTIFIQQHQRNAILGQTVHQGKRNIDMTKTDDAAQMMQRNTKLGFMADLKPQGIVFEMEIAFLQRDVEGVKQLHQSSSA